MKKYFLSAFAIAGLAVGAFVAADHIDSPSVSNGLVSLAQDITDSHVYRGQSGGLVFSTSVRGLLTPGTPSAFDEDVLLQWNIDLDNDLVADRVIQAIPRDGIMYFFGPVDAATNGTSVTVIGETDVRGQVSITGGATAITATNAEGMQFFAGLRDDPFFFDFTQFSEIAAGNATAFNDPGTDTFAGTNVLNVSVEVPTSLIGDGFTFPVNGEETYNVWVTSYVKQ